MILVFNIGSASFRWALFDRNLKKLAGERIEYPDFSKLEELTREVLIKNKSRQGKELDSLRSKESNSGELPAENLTIAHRVVHGGLEFQKPTKITDEVLTKLETLSELAPLHNPPALEVIKVCRRELPDIPNIACFDTSFFADLPDYAKYYALPLGLTEKHQILRYGFHGISHEYVAKEAAKKLKRSLEELQLITCHLGAGVSITATENGKPIDTSMGFTPLEGLMMATRSGNIDPAIVLFLQKRGMEPEEIEKMLNRKSGLLGISGFSSDIRDIIEKSRQEKESGFSESDSSLCEESDSFPDNSFPNPEKQRLRAGLALQMYAYQAKKYIGAYAVALGGLDALVFTGAVAEGSELVRQMITHGLHDVLGDFEILVIPTNEELAIAKKIPR